MSGERSPKGVRVCSRLCGMCGLLASLIIGCESAEKRAPDNADSEWWVQGIVTESASGDALAGVQVEASVGAGQAVRDTTDEGGMYIMFVGFFLPASIEYSKPGFCSVQVGPGGGTICDSVAGSVCVKNVRMSRER